MWVHSSLEQYIQARPWVLSMLSLSILTPNYIKNRLIHIPSATCPTNNGNNVKKNTLISKMLKSLVYTESIHLIGQKVNDTYYQYQYTEEGDYIQSEISMFSGNNFILLSLIISCLIALFAVFVIFVALWRMRRIFGEIYNRYLEQNRKLAKFKKEQDIQNNEDKRFTTFTQSSHQVLKILKLGMFTTNIEEKVIEMDEKNNNDEQKLKSKNKATISFFKAPELYIDYLQRTRSNSLRVFLKSVYESPSHFPNFKMSSEIYYTEVSTRIDELRSKYAEFCTKEGYKPRNIEDEIELLKEYNLEFDIKSDSSTNAYTNIRWKTISEKLINNNGVKLRESRIDQSDKFNPIISFIETECILTSFKSDFILVSDLKTKYDEFCRDRNISELMKLKLEESNEMEEFGAEFDSSFNLPFIKGIIITKIYGLSSSKNKEGFSYLPDVVRIPKRSKSKRGYMKWFRRYRRKINYFLFSKEGVITNILIVLIHLLIIIGVPALILLAVTWSLVQINTINQDIFSKVFTVNDIFNGSSYNFWLDSLPGKEYFYGVAGL